MKNRNTLRSLLLVALAVGLAACGRADKPQLGEGPGADSKADAAAGDTLVGPDEDIYVPPGDAADAPSVPDAIPDSTPGEVQPPDPDIADVVAPPDIPPELPPADVGTPPLGCCLTDADCSDDNDDDVFARICYEGLYGEEPFGVCVLAPEEFEEGRCWVDSHCANGLYCHGAAECGCNVDCDMDYHGPGVCVSDGPCPAIDENWVQEWCDAASIVIFDGEKCVATCPGCCECKPFCDLVFDTMDKCEAFCGGSECDIFDGGCDDAIPEQPWYYFDGVGCFEEDSCMCEGCPGTFSSLQQCQDQCLDGKECPTYIGALADCPYRWISDDLGDGNLCPVPGCMDATCETDADCPWADDANWGGSCVLGNCVYCWNDSQCNGGELCRAGRCVPPPAQCPPAPQCSDPGCHLVTPSEAPCPVCVCDTMFDKQCAEDGYCMQFSSVKYGACVYGRCAECRNDDQCGWGHCLPPGICYDMTPAAHTLYGTWLIGWAGGLDHFSYFRFEPDGTLRRGAYGWEGAWADDIPPMPCWPEGIDPEMPLLGTWEPEITQSGFLVVDLTLNIYCDNGPGWTRRYAVNLTDDWGDAQFTDVDGDMDFIAFKKPTDTCTPDFSTCQVPEGYW